MLSMGRSMSKRSPEIQEIRKKGTFTRFTRFTRLGWEVFSLANQMNIFLPNVLIDNYCLPAVQVSTDEKLDIIIHYK